MKLNKVGAHAVLLVALTPLIPLPFLDEVVRAGLLRRSFRLVADSEGVALPKASLRWLAAEREGCIRGCITVALLWPLKKFFKTMLYFLTIKECLDWMAEASIRTEMVRLSCVDGILPHDPKGARVLMTEVLKAHECSPVMRLLRREVPTIQDIPQGTFSERWVYRMATAGGGVAICGAFSERLNERKAAALMVEE